MNRRNEARFRTSRLDTEPDVGLHVRQLVGEDVADHLHRHPVTRHLLPDSQGPAGKRPMTPGVMNQRTVLCDGNARVLLEQLDVAHDELLPVDEDHGHFLLRQQLALQQRFVEDLQQGNVHRYETWRRGANARLRVRVYLRDELQVIDVVLLGDDQLVDVSLPLPLHGAQHVQQMQVSAP